MVEAKRSCCTRPAGQTSEYEVREGQTLSRFSFSTGRALNPSSPDLRVHCIEDWESGPGQTQHVSWVAALAVTPANVRPLRRGGRARWQVANETFNPLKNQGYHFEHNLGPGPQNRAVVFAVWRRLACLVDPMQPRGEA